MRKYILLLIIFTIIFTACDDGSNNQNLNNNVTLKIGDTGPGGGIIFFAEGNKYMETSGELGSTTWPAAMITTQNHRGGNYTDWRLPNRGELDLLYKNLHRNNLGSFHNSSYWTSDEASASNAWYLLFSNGAQYSGRKNLTSNTRAVRTFFGTGSGSNTGDSTLTINNQSFTDITEVIWQGISFANNRHEDIIQSGTIVKETVQPGAGYIFFKRSTSSIIARTNALVIIEQGEHINFTFTDNTLIVESNNPNNTGTLGTLQRTVVWFDDAEGEYLPYQQRTNTSYSTENPWQGAMSIRIGPNGILSFNLSLERNAMISFWHRAPFSAASIAPTLRINNDEIKKWEIGNEWSFFEDSISTGQTTIEFRTNSTVSTIQLFIDNLLIHYID